MLPLRSDFLLPISRCKGAFADQLWPLGMQAQRFRRRWISSCSVLCRRFLFLYKNTCRKVLPDLLLLFETTPCFFMDSEKLWFVEVALQTRCILESFLELLPNVRNSCFLMRSSYHRPICMSTDNMCIFYTFLQIWNAIFVQFREILFYCELHKSSNFILFMLFFSLYSISNIFSQYILCYRWHTIPGSQDLSPTGACSWMGERSCDPPR